MTFYSFCEDLVHGKPHVVKVVSRKPCGLYSPWVKELAKEEVVASYFLKLSQKCMLPVRRVAGTGDY